MNDTDHDRRKSPRIPIDTEIALVLGDGLVVGTLRDLSDSGAQINVDPDSFDMPNATVQALRLPDGTEIEVRTIWALYDGLIGVGFADEALAQKRLAPLLNG